MANTGPDPRRRARPGEGTGQGSGGPSKPDSPETDQPTRTNDVRQNPSSEAIPTRVKPPQQPGRQVRTGRDVANERKGKGPDRARTTIPDKLGDQVEAKLIEVSAWFTPTAEEFGTENADKAARAFMQLATKYNIIAVMLMRWVMSESALYLVKYLVGMVTAVQVDFERVHPDSKISRWTGVTPAWDATHNREIDIQRFSIGPAVATTGWRGSSERDQWVQYEPPFQFVPVDTNWESTTRPYPYGSMGGSPRPYR